MIRRRPTPTAFEAALKKDTYLQTQFYVAEKLGLTLAELRSRMTEDELLGWSLYYKIRHDAEQAAIDKAKRRR